MATWLGSSKDGVPRLVLRDVRIKRAGQRWTASWYVEGENLHVSSAWGSRTEPVGVRKDLAVRARELLEDIITEQIAGRY